MTLAASLAILLHLAGASIEGADHASIPSCVLREQPNELWSGVADMSEAAQYLAGVFRACRSPDRFSEWLEHEGFMVNSTSPYEVTDEYGKKHIVIRINGRLSEHRYGLRWPLDLFNYYILYPQTSDVYIEYRIDDLQPNVKIMYSFL